MTRNFSVSARLMESGSHLNLKDPRVLVRLGLGVLLLANLVVAVIAFKPWGGSAEDLAREKVNLEQQLISARARLGQSKALVTKAERARKEGDLFLAEYTTDRRTTFSSLFTELQRIAKESGVQPRPASYQLDQVEGSDSLYQMGISAAYEGSYTNLTKFINLLDRSPRFLIIESLMASPQQTNGVDVLSVTIKLDTFVREQPGSNPI
jgi:type IV pilus assembly protein PilO